MWLIRDIAKKLEQNGVIIAEKNLRSFLEEAKFMFRNGLGKWENELVKATLMYLDDPDAPEGVAFIRWLAVQDYLGEKINWKDLT